MMICLLFLEHFNYQTNDYIINKVINGSVSPKKIPNFIKGVCQAPESMTVVGLVPNVQSKLIDSPFQVHRSGYYI